MVEPEIHAHASAPGGGVHGEIRGRDDVEIYFSSGFYGEASEAELEQRLEALFRLLWVEFEKARQRGQQVYADNSEVTDADRRFFKERDALVAEGGSDDARITITAQGLQPWRVHITDGTVRALREPEFCAGIQTAAARLINDRLAQAIQLRGRIYR
ncbi:hypothetical protein KZ829_22310 [Actinoplanes hulinensis]|uniref:Uncharacterized protein n=1 Tax=Actinoplanes hulinensis TaxID=1144547 RepID=A0ABS7B7P7_9ACTN|nr:hypothetical protein [Actinoplanes hulinensis]MBW6436479.1 hypothetical protein [Actinoplanes hulinensis]